MEKTEKKNQNLSFDDMEKMSPAERAQIFVKGEIALKVPMHSAGKEVAVLHYDFSKLTSRDIIKVLDMGGDSAGNLTAKQAIQLFSTMADKVERGISGLDGKDISEQISTVDTLSVVSAARSFFLWSYGEAVMNITRM